MGGRLTVAARWSTIAASVTGSSHRARDEPGQDAVATHALDDGTVVVAVADGAGSAPLAAEGSALAVAAAVACIADGAPVEDAFDAARDALGDDPSARATTLLVAVLAERELCVGQVGDGFVVARRCGGDYEVLAPSRAEHEYLNETTFLSSPGWREDLRVDVVDAADVEGVALLTDGLQLVAVELATTTPHAPFFDPVFEWAASGTATGAELEAFLASERVAARTDDDVTLALAVRAP